MGGNSVFVTGTFTKWKNHIPLQRDGYLFSTTIVINNIIEAIIKRDPSVIFKLGIRYKFIVDGEWRFNSEDPTTPDDQGNINNIIDTTQGNTGRIESEK